MKSFPKKRSRGRPQLRPDEETRQIVYAAARHEFAVSGYAATSTETVARRAGISTRTLYRLIPTKAALFEALVADRLDRFLADVNLNMASDTDIEAALAAALMICADLTLDAEVVALQRIVLQDWLRGRITRGQIALDDPEEAAGILIGMVASAPQRAAIYGGVPLPSRAEIARRVRTCARLFLRGCAR
jgi:AcrR family transcriptional regulator